MFNIKNGKVLNYDNKIDLKNENGFIIKNDDRERSNEFNSFKNTNNQQIKEASDEFIDNEIYAKFLMFLQFEEKMKKKN